jgi:predicted nucleotidyltransferase
MDLETLRQYKPQILEIAKQCSIDNIRVFGSVARGNAHAHSDIDFLVHVQPETGLKLGRFHWQLEELLVCNVDVVPDNSVHWYIRERVFQEAIPL